MKSAAIAIWWVSLLTVGCVGALESPAGGTCRDCPLACVDDVCQALGAQGDTGPADLGGDADSEGGDATSSSGDPGAATNGDVGKVEGDSMPALGDAQTGDSYSPPPGNETMPPIFRTLALNVNFIDRQPGCELNTMLNTSSKSVRNYYETVSNDRHTISFTTATVSIPHRTSDAPNADECKFGYDRIWMEAAASKARAAGHVLESFDNVLYIFPQTPCGGWWGYCTSVDGVKAALVTKCNKPLTVHELGHCLFRLHHSYKDGNAYGDASCPMGKHTKYVEFNAAHRVSKGFISEQSITKLTPPVAATTETIELSPLNWDPASVPNGRFQAIEIERANDVRPLILAYRAAFGPYDSQALPRAYSDKINIHDTTRRAYPSYDYSDFKAALGQGETWSDTENGLSITVVSISGAQGVARIRVTATPSP